MANHGPAVVNGESMKDLIGFESRVWEGTNNGLVFNLQELGAPEFNKMEEKAPFSHAEMHPLC